MLKKDRKYIMQSNSITIIIPYKSKSKASARKGKYGNWYNPSSKLMNTFARIVKQNIPKNSCFPLNKNIPVSLSVSFFFAPTKTESTKKFLEKIKNDDYPYIKKPDLSNLIKAIEDFMSKIVFNDDNQIYNYDNISKFYSLNQRTEITISWGTEPLN